MHAPPTSGGQPSHARARQQSAAPAKIIPPTLAGIFSRARLFHLLDRGGQHPIVWVTGPPGAGKTTLVASYLAARKLRALWYQLDETDADVATFFYYMRLAAARAAPRARPLLPLLAPEYLGELAAFARRYFRDLYARLKPPFVLVFDNYQEVAADSAFHAVLRDGLAELPEGGRVILISRSAPPPALARFRASQALGVLGWEELRLTLPESSGILRLRTRRRLSPDTLRVLHAMTEGWAAGLVLLTERLAADAPAARSPGELASQEVFDYFAGELFLNADRRTQDVLLETAFLPRMTARMADALTGSAGAGRVLAELTRKNYFIARRADGEPVYEYHPLFRQFLLSRAGETFTRPRRTRVQRAAAGLLEASGQVEDAAQLLQDAGDWAALGGLIGRHAPELLAQGRSQTLEEWLRKMPAAILEQTPWLLYWLGTCRLPFDLAEARACFEQAYERFKAEDEASGLFLAWAGVVDSFVYEWGNFAPLDRWIAECDTLRARHPQFPSPEVEARVATGMFCALIHRRPDHPEVPLWEARVRAIVLGDADLRLRTSLAYHLLLYHCWWSTDLRKAALLMDALRPAVDAAGIPPLARIAWHATEAAYQWVTANHAACLAAVDKGLEVARAHGIHLWDFMLYANGAWGRITSEEPAGAAEFLPKLAAVLDPKRRWDVAHYHFLVYLDAWHRGDAGRAAEHARAAWQAVRESGSPFGEGLACIAMARVLVGEGKAEEARPYVARVYAIARGMGSRGDEYHCLVSEAELALDRGDEAAAVERLREVAPIMREHGYVTHPWWRQETMARLCALALEHGIEGDYVRDLIRRRRLLPPGETTGQLEAWPWAVRVRTLGPFELEVDGRPVRFAGKAQRRPLDLLKALVAFGGREVREGQLAEALWPEAEGDAAHSSVTMNLHRLRRLLGHEEAIRRQEGRLTLDARYCWVDTWALTRLLTQAEEPRSLGERARLLEAAGGLHRGPFLAGETAPWAGSLRERLQARLLRQLLEVGRCWEEQGAWAEAVRGYERALEVDECAEEAYRRLMAAHHCLGRQAEALAVYRRCRRALAAGLGVEPSAETEALRQSLRVGPAPTLDRPV